MTYHSWFMLLKLPRARPKQAAATSARKTRGGAKTTVSETGKLSEHGDEAAAAAVGKKAETDFAEHVVSVGASGPVDFAELQKAVCDFGDGPAMQEASIKDLLRGRSTVPSEDGVTWSTAQNCWLENGKPMQLPKSSKNASDDKKKKGGKDDKKKKG